MPCFYCGVRLRPRGPFMRTKDHVIPKSKGGTWTVEACLKCNGAKRDMSLEEFRRLRGGIEFWGEGKARVEAEKTSWIYEFDAEKKTIAPSPLPLPRYVSMYDVKHAEGKANPPMGLPPSLPDLRGTKYGAFTVKRWANKRSRWVVVCICGAKEYRKTRAVCNPANTFDACVECRKPVGKLRSDIMKATGVEVSWEDCFLYIYDRYLEPSNQHGTIPPNADDSSCIQPE